MAYITTQCGGLKINTSALKLINGIVTDVNAVSVANSFNASCGGQYFDSLYFKTVNGVVTANGATTVEKSFPANCGLLFDSAKFALDANGAIQYKPALLTMGTTPNDATVLVTDWNGNVVNPNAQGKYPVMVTKEYTYTVSKENYDTVTQSIVISNDLLIEVTLQYKTAYLAFSITPDDATILVTDENDNPVQESENGKYPVTVTKEYTYTVSKEGYVAQTASVVISNDLTIDVVLTENP